MATLLADKFQAKHKLDPRSNKRAWATLLRKSSDVKEVLSANKETTVFIEGLMDGIDMQLPLQRKELEDSFSLDQLVPVLDSTIKQAGLTNDQISSVELIGGGSRIPKITSVVSEHFNKAEVGTHINGDECMALGAVLHAANMSITFKVKQIHLYDGWTFELTYKIQSKANQSEGVLFAKHTPHTSKLELDLPTQSEDHVIDIQLDG